MIVGFVVIFVVYYVIIFVVIGCSIVSWSDVGCNYVGRFEYDVLFCNVYYCRY